MTTEETIVTILELAEQGKLARSKVDTDKMIMSLCKTDAMLESIREDVERASQPLPQ